jgi:hypothetical protein
MDKLVGLGDIRMRIQIISGKLLEIDACLLSKDCPKDRLGMIDFCTKSVHQQLERLAHVLAQGKKKVSDDR